MFGLPPGPHEIYRDPKGVPMKSTRIRILTIGAAVALAVAVAIAQGMHGHHGPDVDFSHILGFFTDYLDLTSAQQDQATAFGQTQKPPLYPLPTPPHQNHPPTHH